MRHLKATPCVQMPVGHQQIPTLTFYCEVYRKIILASSKQGFRGSTRLHRSRCRPCIWNGAKRWELFAAAENWWAV